MREGVGADAPTKFIWGMWTGGEKRIWDFGFGISGRCCRRGGRKFIWGIADEFYLGHVDRRGRNGFRTSDLGFRISGRCAADAARIIYGACAQAGLKSPMNRRFTVKNPSRQGGISDFELFIFSSISCIAREIFHECGYPFPVPDERRGRSGFCIARRRCVLLLSKGYRPMGRPR